MVNAHHLVAAVGKIAIFKLKLEEQGLRINRVVVDAILCNVLAADYLKSVKTLSTENTTNLIGLAFAAMGNNFIVSGLGYCNDANGSNLY